MFILLSIKFDAKVKDKTNNQEPYNECLQVNNDKLMLVNKIQMDYPLKTIQGNFS